MSTYTWGSGLLGRGGLVDFDPDPVEPGPTGPANVCDCGVTDSFARTVAGGWGTSDSGLAWVGADSSLSVDGGAGQIVTSGYGNVSNAIYPTDLIADFTVTAQTVGSPGFFVVLNNSVGDTIEVDFDGGGGVVSLYSDYVGPVTTTLGFGANTPFKVRVVVTSNTSFDAYVWEASGSQPLTPTVSLTDGASSFLVPAYEFVIGAFDYGGAWSLSVLDVDLGINRCTQYKFDNFDRTRSTSTGWGTSSTGITWTHESPLGFSANGVYGIYEPELSTGHDGIAAIPATSIAPTGIVEFTARIVMTNTTTHARYYCEPQFYVAHDSGGGAYADRVGIDVWIDAGGHSSYIEAINFGTDQPGDVPFLSLSTAFEAWGTDLMVHAVIQGGRVQANIWKASDSEPAGWMAQGGDTAYAFASGARDAFYIFDPNVGQTLKVDYLDFKYPGKLCYAGGPPIP